MDGCTRTRYTPVGTAGGLSSGELIDKPKWIHLHIGWTAQTTLGPPKTVTIDFSDTTGLDVYDTVSQTSSL